MSEKPLPRGAGEITVKVTADTRKLEKQLKALQEGIDSALSKLKAVEEGCPECGYDKMVFVSLQWLDDGYIQGTCAECNAAYKVKRDDYNAEV